MRQMKRLLIVCVLLVAVATGGFAWWINQPLPLPAEGVEFTVPPRVPFARVARDLEAKGYVPSARIATLAARFWNIAPQVQAGDYHLEPPMNLRQLLKSLTNGQSSQLKFTIVEGWNLRDLFSAIGQAPEINTTVPLTKIRLAEALEIPAAQLEGQFFPDTYFYAAGSDPISLLRQAHRKMRKELQSAWDQRNPDLPYANMQELLIMASIIEKETGDPRDRTKVASVFVNRQRIGMRLQTDPTVIYGLGDTFDGNLTRAHLQTDTPYNTYTRAGFPPTPIALPGRAALEAAINPAQSKFMYFVSRGNGTSEFSETLAQHNAAVAKFQLKQ
jgi:UPF0755 protein